MSLFSYLVHEVHRRVHRTLYILENQIDLLKREREKDKVCGGVCGSDSDSTVILGERFD